MADFYFVDSFSTLLKIKLKERNDSVFDQVPRLFVHKAFMTLAIIMAITWFNHETRCIPPSNNVLPVTFIHRACWIKGLYVHPELHQLVDDTAYYGIPTQLQNDGYKTTGHGGDIILCQTGEKDKRCKPMKKEYFNQYKWMPFYMIFLSFAFHFPYFIYQLANKDLIRLKNILHNKKLIAEDIVDTFFHKEDRQSNGNKIRLMANYLVKILYICSGFMSLLIIDHLTNGRFRTYGMDWADWSPGLTFKDDQSSGPTPLNKFLPIFAICDVVDVRLDLLRRHANKMTVVCEITSHIIYQYAFILIWFLLVISTTISCVGLVLYAYKHARLIFKQVQQNDDKPYKQHLSLREWEYLRHIGRTNLGLYNDVIKMVNEQYISHDNGILANNVNNVNIVSLSKQGEQFRI